MDEAIVSRIDRARAELRNPAVSKRLDAMTDNLEPEPEKITYKPQRPHGRPRGGRARFHRVILDRLPEEALGSSMAKSLKISRATLYAWTKQKKNPLPCLHSGKGWGSCIFRKKDIIAWMIATRRYKKKIGDGL